MTFNPDAQIGSGGARRRGRGRTTAAVGGGAVGLVALAVILLSAFTGVDLSPLLGGSSTGSSSYSDTSGDTELTECVTGADANERDDCRMAAGSVVINQFWAERVDGYREPTLVIVDGSASNACGAASNAVGPFYCPADEGVYIDPEFFELMRQQFDASAQELAQLYILAHEYGHHVQHITGAMSSYPNNGTGPGSNGVRIELQADCYAGAWVGEMTEFTDANGVPYLEPPTSEQLADAINATESVGDDHLQAQQGMVNPETWSHGSSAQRQQWFTQGYQSGVGACDTLTIPESQL